jgi:hypothetical protein
VLRSIILGVFLFCSLTQSLDVAWSASTVNPSLPQADSALSSAPVQQNFSNAYNDINGIEGCFAGSVPPPNPLRFQCWANTKDEPASIALFDGSVWVPIGQQDAVHHLFIPAGTVPFHMTDTTSSTSPTTGALTVAGGFGVGGAIQAAGSIVMPNAPGGSVSFPGSWSTLIRQNDGMAMSTGHMYVWADQNALLSSDFFILQAPNPIIAHLSIAGTPTAGEKPGYSIVLKKTTGETTTYRVTYTVQASDDTLQKVAKGLQACLTNDQTGAQCATTPSSLTAALLTFGWRASAGNAQLYTTEGGIDFDVPPPPVTTSHEAVPTEHLSLSIYPPSVTNGNTDNGPFFSVVTNNPGRIPVRGDQLGMYRIDGMSTSGTLDTQYGSINGTIVDPTAGKTVGRINIGTTQGGNPAAVTSVAVSKGVFTQDASGTGQLLSDCGAGCLHSVNVNADNGSVTGTGANTTTASPGGLTLTTSSTNVTNLMLANTSVGGKQWLIQTPGSGVIGQVGNIELQNGTDNVSAFRITPAGHWVAPGKSPRITSGSGFGNGASVTGSDVAGRVIVGTSPGTSGALTFGAAYGTAPVCIAQDETTRAANPMIASATPSGVSLTAAATMVVGDKVTYLCLAYQ